MKINTTMKHVALNYNKKEKADIFFAEILGLKLIKSFPLSKKLSEKIFNIAEEADIMIYENENMSFEIFITKKIQNHIFDHICIEIEDKEEFIRRCKKYSLDPYFVDKGDKKLLFVKDFPGNLFEIK